MYIRDTLRHRRDIEEAYLEAIGKAQKEIVLANAYFLPGRRFRQVLLAAAARGVQVTILLQGRIEQRLEKVRRAYAAFLKIHPDHARARLAYGSFLSDIQEEDAAKVIRTKNGDLG